MATSPATVILRIEDRFTGPVLEALAALGIDYEVLEPPPEPDA